MQGSEGLFGAVDQTAAYLPRLTAAAVAFATLVVMGRILASGVGKLLQRRGSARPAALIRNVVQWSLAAFGLVIALQLLGLTAVAGSLLATGGLMAVILGFAFRSIGENLLAGLFLGFSRAFEVGDLIESSGHTGIVRDVNLRSVHIRSSDGRDIFIPCAQIFSNVLVNFTRDGRRRADFVIGVDYRHDPNEVIDRLLGAVRTIPGILSDPAPTVQISSFEAQYQEFRALFWVDTRAAAGLPHLRTLAMRAALTTLREADILLSSDVSSTVSLEPVRVALEQKKTADDVGG